MDTMTAPTSAAPRSAFTRNALLAAGGLTLAGVGLAAGMLFRTAPQTAELPAANPAAAQTAMANNQAVADPKQADATPQGTPVPNASPAPVKTPVAKAPVHKTAPHETHASNGSTPLATQPAAICSTCGVIEGVRETSVKGSGTGLGAIAGGVAGGLVGHQVGGGKGKTAMTVLGAIGGGLAGNEVEKRARSETVYEVRVRMDDGSVRTFTEKTAPTPGSRVTVDGNTLHVTGSNGGSGQMMKTSTGA